MAEAKEILNKANYGGQTLYNALFQGKAIQCKADFRNVVFDCFADFEKSDFSGEVDFSGAIFKQGASFKNAVFENNGLDVSFENAVFEPSENGVSFAGALFGRPYERFCGNWEIWFTERDGRYTIIRRKKGEFDEDKREFKEIKDGQVQTSILEGLDINSYSYQINRSFLQFKKNPGNVKFANCCFGALRIEELPNEAVINISGKEKKRVASLPQKEKREEGKKHLEEMIRYFENNRDAEQPHVGNLAAFMLILSRYLTLDQLADRRIAVNMPVTFAKAFFINNGDVDFTNSLFANHGTLDFRWALFANIGGVNFRYSSFICGEAVSFRDVTFSNKGRIYFSEVLFANNGSVFFMDASFMNIGSVVFNDACFLNSGDVWFLDTFFANHGNVTYTTTSFINDGDVFIDASFKNSKTVSFFNTFFGCNKDVSFNHSCFNNGGSIYFSRIVWINNGSLDLSTVEFHEKFDIKFYECLFLSKEAIILGNLRFPEKRRLLFQRSHFARTTKVIFDGTTFGHTIFEGGEISGFRASKKHPTPRTTNELLNDRGIIPPSWLSDFKIPKFTNAFADEVVVSWKDLTTESAKNLIFRLVNLSHSIFDGLTLSHIQLNAPKWLKKKGRSILYEESLLDRNNEDYLNKVRNVENQYTQLRSNFEKCGDYTNAGDFHYGEQEMRRMRFHWFWRVGPSLTNIYRISCGYGGRPARAGFYAAYLILAFGLMGYSVPYFADFRPVFINESDFWYTAAIKTVAHLLIPFEKATNIREISNSDFWYHPLLFIGKILIYLQTTMFVLAVRRRFKR